MNNISYYISKLLKKIHIPAIKNSRIHQTSKVLSYSHVVDSSISQYSYIGNNCTVINAKIGKFCSIADNVTIGGASHPIEWVSTSPIFHEGKNILNKNFSKHSFSCLKRTIIKNDVWIGNNALVKGGITIENGAVIGMGAVVTKNIGPFEIWGGNPAKLIRKRFTDDEIKSLLNLEWWNLSDQELNNYSLYICNHKTFIKKLSGD